MAFCRAVLISCDRAAVLVAGDSALAGEFSVATVVNSTVFADCHAAM
jgi:hypothetical protein